MIWFVVMQNAEVILEIDYQILSTWEGNNTDWSCIFPSSCHVIMSAAEGKAGVFTTGMPQEIRVGGAIVGVAWVDLNGSQERFFRSSMVFASQPQKICISV